MGGRVWRWLCAQRNLPVKKKTDVRTYSLTLRYKIAMLDKRSGGIRSCLSEVCPQTCHVAGVLRDVQVYLLQQSFNTVPSLPASVTQTHYCGFLNITQLEMMSSCLCSKPLAESPLGDTGVGCHQLYLLGTDLYAVGCRGFVDTLN